MPNLRMAPLRSLSEAVDTRKKRLLSQIWAFHAQNVIPKGSSMGGPECHSKGKLQRGPECHSKGKLYGGPRMSFQREALWGAQNVFPKREVPGGPECHSKIVNGIVRDLWHLSQLIMPLPSHHNLFKSEMPISD
jgi:hypothetical protein